MTEALREIAIETLRLAHADYMVMARAEHPRGLAGYQWDRLVDVLTKGDQ